MNICLTHILLHVCGGGVVIIILIKMYIPFFDEGGYTYGVTYGPMIIGSFVLNFEP